MRAQLLTYLTENLTGSIRPSLEQPWTEGGQPLYLKNMKRVYLGEPETVQDQLLGTFDSDVTQKITTIAGFLTVDAKTRNADLDSCLTIMAQAKDVNTITDSFRKEFDYTSSIEADRITYQFEYRFYTIA